MQALLLFITAYIVTYILQNMIKTMLIDAGQVTVNFKGNKIPGVMGIAIILSTVLTTFISTLWGARESFSTLYMLFVCSMVGFVGMMDDFVGDHLSKGFKGHILNLMKGKLTTGGLKAIVGGVVAAVIAVQISETFLDLILNIVLISMVTNFVNLLDTRPGRAIKGFIVVILPVVVINPFLSMHYIILGALAAYLPLDLRSQAMLGDTGANFIGIVLGITIAVSIQSSVLRAILMILSVILNLVSEKYSFTKVIETNSVLRFVDGLGRK